MTHQTTNGSVFCRCQNHILSNFVCQFIHKNGCGYSDPLVFAQIYFAVLAVLRSDVYFFELFSLSHFFLWNSYFIFDFCKQIESDRVDFG